MIDPRSAVRISLTAAEEGRPEVAFFECRGCEEYLRWSPRAQGWVCPECAYDLTGPEAQVLVELSQGRLAVLQKYVTLKTGVKPVQVREGWWSWILRHLFRRPPQKPLSLPKPGG